MRTFEEVKAEVDHVMSISDADSLMRLATELDDIGSEMAEATAHNVRGNAFLMRGIYPMALEHYHRALALCQELGDSSGVATCTGNIGIVHQNTGDYPSALEHYHRGLTLQEEIGDRIGVAAANGNIGSVYHSTGDYASALLYSNLALKHYEELGDKSGVAVVIGNIGSVYHSTVNYTSALEHCHRALAHYEELGDRSGVALATGNIIASLLAMASYTEALALLEKMDDMHIDDQRVRINRLTLRATLQEQSGDLDTAAITLMQALSEATHHSLRSQEAKVHKSLRDLAQKRNDFAAYIEHNNEHSRITEELNGKEATIKMAMQLKQREIEAERKETEKHMAVLHSTLPRHIADRVARGEMVNDHHDNASVLFLDIVDFTSISDRIPSGHVVHLLEQIFTTLDAVCEKHDVVKIKTIGDSYMAVSFESVSNAATCALEMIASLNALEITMPPSLGDTSWVSEVGEIEVRIGIHCGPVTAGVIGTRRMQYDVWGDTVNVASRMESTSEPGRIHVSGAFAELLSGFNIVARGETEVKGKGMMNTYWLAP